MDQTSFESGSGSNTPIFSNPSASRQGPDLEMISQMANQAIENAVELQALVTEIKAALAEIEFAEQMDNQETDNISSNAAAIGRIP